MSIKGVTSMPKWMQKKCPFCHKELNVLEFIKRKTIRMCICKKCGKIIDERYIKY